MPHSQHQSHPAVTLSVRVPTEARDQLEELSQATGRTKSFLAAEAIQYYLATQTWQVKAIEKSIKNADGKNSRFIEHQKVTEWLNSWGDKDEQEPPK